MLATLTTIKNSKTPYFLYYVLAIGLGYLLLLPVHAKDNSQAASTIKSQERKKLIVGILTHDRSISLKNSLWELTFQRLNQHPEYHFSPLFLTKELLNESLQNDWLDFVICDAINYNQFEKEHNILRLLTRNVQYNNELIASEGLSVYTLNDNAEITQLNDLTHKKLGVLDDSSSISWLFLQRFLAKHKLIINDNIHIENVTNIKIILAILYSRQVDAIITKSGLIERHFSQEKMNKLRLLNPHRGWNTPFIHSSTLIPEWPIAKAWFIDESLASEVIRLLLKHQMTESNAADSKLSRQYQWGIAQSYNDLNILLAPANNSIDTSTQEQDSFSPKLQYWVSFIIICFLVIVLILYLRSSKDLNSRLTLSKESLEQEIKERQHAQEQALNHQAELAHVARLSTMGEMASGLAHELNQPLSAINTYIQGCIRRINMGAGDSEAITNALQLASQQAERAAGIIRRLRSFVRKGESHKTYSEINHLVNEVTSFLEIQLKDRKVSLKLELEDNLPPVLADIIQVEQVLINLLKNAIEAMSEIESPTIVISTKLHNQKQIELCVVDSGHGISEDKLKRIFNPFFTTKSGGMGMGLSISSSIIEAHDGKLYALNNIEQGAKFCFTLPITEEQTGNNNE